MCLYADIFETQGLSPISNKQKKGSVVCLYTPLQPSVIEMKGIYAIGGGWVGGWGWVPSRSICHSSKIRLMRSLVTSIFLYTCESWTFTAELQRRVRAMDMRLLQETMHLIQRPC